MWYNNPLPLMENLHVHEFSPDCKLLHQGWGLRWDCVLACHTYYYMAFFLFAQCEEIS